MTSYQKDFKHNSSQELLNSKHTSDESEGLSAFKKFCTPSLSNRRSSDHNKLVKRARRHLEKAEKILVSTSICKVQTYILSPDTIPKANILVVHGWTGEAAFMSTFGDFLKRRGYRVILIDLPAHGNSEGDMVSLFDCATAILEVAEHFTPIQFALGHSVGAMALLTAGEGHYPLKHHYPFEAYTLVSMPNEFTSITRDFGNHLGLSTKAQTLFEKQLEKLAGREISNFTGTNLLTNINRPTLLIHSRDDAEVSFKCAEEITNNVPDADLIPFDQLGHRAILYAPPVIRASTHFFNQLCSEN